MQSDQLKYVLHNEVNRYFSRNKTKVYDSKDDRILKVAKELVNTISCTNANWLEIGCSDGRRFKYLQDIGFNTFGVEPSNKAFSEGIEVGNKIIQSDASTFKYDIKFNIIHLGFFLYLCPPEDYFSIINNVNRHLLNGGLVLIEDFDTKRFIEKKYAHDEKITMYKYDFSNLFNWHPYYKVISKNIYASDIYNEQTHESVTIMQKLTPR